jgi:hypothetical protein
MMALGVSVIESQVKIRQFATGKSSISGAPAGGLNDERTRITEPVPYCVHRCEFVVLSDARIRDSQIIQPALVIGVALECGAYFAPVYSYHKAVRVRTAVRK